MWDRQHAGDAISPSAVSTADSRAPADCPFDCGICSNHEQATCTAILEVAYACNLNCPICFNSTPRDSAGGPDMDQIEVMLKTIRDERGICPLQISGGEPTLREDLPKIVSLARRIGFDHIQINTNGIRLALDATYGQALKDAGITDIFLQFDGITDEAYSRIRGAKLLPIKLRAVERCAQLKVGLILVPTLVRGVNDSQIGAIIQFAKKWIPAVKGVHFQPMAYLGRYPCAPRNEE